MTTESFPEVTKRLLDDIAKAEEKDLEEIDIPTCNYRIIVRGRGKNKMYYLCEVYYNSKKKPVLWDAESSEFDYSYDNLKSLITSMTKAFEKPTLKEIDLKNGKYKLEKL